MLDTQTEPVYQFEDLIRVVKRENNSRRSFLFLNRMQAKYIPSDPAQTLRLFRELGRKTAALGCPKPVVVIGFAETATAIGMAAALELGRDSFYLHTTREKLEHGGPPVFFREEHSHAPGHSLYCREWQRLKDAGTIVFADDEFTTGKTICNFAGALRERGLLREDTALAAVSLINCMSQEDLDRFSASGIRWTAVIRETGSWENMSWPGNAVEDRTGGSVTRPFRQIRIFGNPGIRTGTVCGRYDSACLELAAVLDRQEIISHDARRVLLLGTEEFMYPVIRAGAWMKERYPSMEVKVHAASRSPIMALDGAGYPVENRSRLPSLYDENRQVFLYNLDRYDQVILITDVRTLKPESIQAYVSVLEQFGNRDITVVQWAGNGEEI